MEITNIDGKELKLVKCPVCGGEAKCVQFGIRGCGVWIGCDRSMECSRYIEVHLRGWSIEETARDWNRRNSGVCKVIRNVKGWFRRHFGKWAREERRIKKQKMAEKAEKEEKLKELFGAK